MRTHRSVLALLVLNSPVWSGACGGEDPDTSSTAVATTIGDAGTLTTSGQSGEVGGSESVGDGDGDATTSTSGDGDGTSQTSGDGDGTMGPNSSMTHIEYSGGGISEIVDFSDCQFCDVNDVVTHILLRFQQDGGWTIWALYVPVGATPGTLVLTQDYSGAYATLSANQSSLPGAAQGMYFGDTNVGSVNLTAFDTSPGGSIAGTIDVRMTKDQVTAHLTATFQGEMP